MKTIEINGVTFELHKSGMHPVAPITGADDSEIYQCYGRPSVYKVEIWKSWCEWCREVNRTTDYKCGIQIESHNGFAFTITGSLRSDNEVYHLWITKAHNRAYVYPKI